MEERFGGQDKDDLAGQFGAGVLLGAVWTPCPTPGAASVLAAQGRDLVQVAPTMLLFAIGTAASLLLGLLSREALLRWSGRMLASGQGGRDAAGNRVLLATGALLLSGLDKSLEAAILNATPAWLGEFATRF